MSRGFKMTRFKVGSDVFWKIVEIVVVGSFLIGGYYTVINGMQTRVCKLEDESQQTSLKVNSLENDIKWIKEGVGRIERRLERR
jgi:hypothetical protein